MPKTFPEVISENENLRNTLDYFFIAEIIACVLLIVLLVYLFRGREKAHKKALRGGGSPFAGMPLLGTRGAPSSVQRQLMNPLDFQKYACQKPGTVSCPGGDATMAYIQSNKLDIYRRKNPERAFCATAPKYGWDFRPGRGTVCEAEDKLFGYIHNR